MRRLPFPAVDRALLALWLLLTGSMAPGTVVLGGVLALGAGRALTALDPPKSRFRRPRAALRLALVVLAEIVRSNNAVARIILLPDAAAEIGLRAHPARHARSLRAGGAGLHHHGHARHVWVEYDSADNTMLLHVLDLIDEEEWVRIIKDRYETRLMEIFE